MVVSFIAQSYRVEEHRARLMLAGPLTPLKLAGVKVLLPTCFVGIGALATIPLTGLAILIAGRLESTTMSVVVVFTSQFLAYAQLGPLAQESVASRRQGRIGHAILGWAVFALSILILGVAQVIQHSIAWPLAVVGVVVTTMILAAILYVHRTDFTR